MSMEIKNWQGVGCGMGGHVSRRMRSCLCGPSLQAVGRLAEKRISYIDPRNLGLLSVVEDYWLEQNLPGRCFLEVVDIDGARRARYPYPALFRGADLVDRGLSEEGGRG